MCATIYRGQRGKPLGFPLKFAQFRSRQLGEKLASRIFTRASKTTHSDNKVIAQLCQFCMNARKRSLRKIDCVRCVSAPLFANTFAFAGKVSRAILILCVPRNIARRGKLRTLMPLAKRRARWGCPQSLDNLFYQLKTNCENLSHTVSTVIWSFVNTQISLAIFKAL